MTLHILATALMTKLYNKCIMHGIDLRDKPSSNLLLLYWWRLSSHVPHATTASMDPNVPLYGH